jgi:putative ABC transport system permease protein
MIRSLWALQSIDPGFNPRNLLTLVVRVKGSSVMEPSRRTVFFQQLLEDIRALPSVQSAGAINHLPLAGDIWGFAYWIEGRPVPLPGDEFVAVYRVVMPDYFQAMDIPLLEGRDISAHDNLSTSGVVVVNERLARKRWPGEDAVGKRITLSDPRSGDTWLTVVGVVKNTRQHEWAETPDDEVYLPYLQSKQYLEATSGAFSYLTFAVRTSGNPSGMASAVRNAVWSLDRSVAVSQLQTMDRVVSTATVQPHFYFLLLGTFAVVAMILAAVGIYGVMSYSVSNRAHEIAIRMALGANQGEVLRLVTRQGMSLAICGAVLGLAGALLLTRLMSSLLYGVRPTDPLTFVAVSLLLMIAAFLASYIPARRATKVDPVECLRYE